MRGTRAVGAEIARGVHQSVPEMVLPDAIDHHARGERIGGIGDPLSQRETALLLLCQLVSRRYDKTDRFPRLQTIGVLSPAAARGQIKLYRDDREGARLDHFAFLHWITAMQTGGRA